MIDLIQPVRSGRRLLDEIEAMDPVYPGVACWWLGPISCCMWAVILDVGITTCMRGVIVHLESMGL